MFGRKETQVEIEMDITDVQKGIRNAKIWMIFNAVLFVGAVALLYVPGQIQLLALGIFHCFNNIFWILGFVESPVAHRFK